MKTLARTLLLSLAISSSAYAQQSFVVQKIEVQGLQRVTPATVESYLPIKRGQTLRSDNTAAVVRALYKTGFFDHITLSRDGGTLIINVVERPTIGQLKIKGNSVIPTDKLTIVLNSLDIADGRVYNPVVLERIKQSLLNQYYQLGRYNARVDITTKPMPRNRVLVNIDISEGLVSKIKRINIIGNHVFKDSTLVKNMDVSTTNIWSIVTQSDRYSEERLETSLDKLRGYYMDHGYVRFEVKSSQAEVTPDRKSVYINIVVDEGEQYTVSGYDITGKLIFPKEDFNKLVKVHSGDVFSRQKALDTQKAITDYLGEKGYMFATVALHPKINDKTKQVFLDFEIKPGKRAYVRHITFSDNHHTNDYVLRREMVQMEAAPVSTQKLETSKHRLLMLPFIKEADMSVQPAKNRNGEDTSDMVDVNYKVKEDNSAQASVKLGYSQINRTTIGAGLTQKNFFGTGNDFGINLSRSKFQQVYAIDYTDPYYTVDGISRSLSMAISKTDPKAAGAAFGYTTSEFDAGVLFGIPVGQEPGVFNRIQAGLSYQNTLIHLKPQQSGSMGLSNQINDFITRHGTHYQQADFKLGFTRDSRDKAIFPTTGSLHSLFFDAYAPVSSGGISYYALNYATRWYQPLSEQFILLTKGNLGYGSGFSSADDFPFFKYYYAGGIDSVRGYQGYSLGPKDSNYNPFGGNALVDASLALIFPNYVSDNLRTSVYFDAGNVYSSGSNRRFGGQSTDTGPLRYSVGVEADWLTPFGPVQLSLAQPINRRPHDERETFQFAMGANF
ncbi:MAG: outer membrane protein assembly factor BamA [Gammaproteobacteria bacterium]